MAGGVRPSTRLLTVKEVAAKLGISPKTIYNGISRGARYPFAIKPLRLGKGRLPRWRESDIDDYIYSLNADD